MSSVHRPKEVRAEKKTELFRIHMENTLTMDYLTGWIKKIVGLPENKRPANVLKFLIENRNLWSGNVVNRAMLRAIEDMHKKLTEIQESNRRLRRQNAQLEMLLLNRRLAALDASARMMREKNDNQKPPAAGNPFKQRSRPEKAASPKQRSRSVGGPSPKQQSSHARGGASHPMPMPLCGDSVMRETSNAVQLNELTGGITA